VLARGTQVAGGGRSLAVAKLSLSVCLSPGPVGERQQETGTAR